MPKISEEQLKNWTKPLSDSEDTKCSNAETMIRDAINADPVLSSKGIVIFCQGSYKNNTNVRLNSDVDVCVMLEDVFHFHLPPDTTKEQFGITPTDYTFEEFKNRVEYALRQKFGTLNVKRGNKSIKVKANTYRIDADVVPCFEHRRFTGFDTFNQPQFISGTRFIADNGGDIINFPKQHTDNGIQKNKETSLRYKNLVRIFKKINYDLGDANNTYSAKPSFLLESLAWNVPNAIYLNNNNYVDLTRQALAHIYEYTQAGNEHLSEEWGEVSELLYLFRNHGKWTRNDANDFLINAWNHIGY